MNIHAEVTADPGAGCCGRNQDGQPCPAGRRRARRFRLGRARPAAGGRADRVRGDQRHQRRRRERDGACLRAYRRRARGRQAGAEDVLAANRPHGVFSPLQPSPWDRLTHNHGLENSPAYLAFDILSRVFSPYQLNPLNINPLKSVLEEVVDFEQPAARMRGEAVSLGDQCPDLQGEGVHRRGDLRRRRAGLRPACLSSTRRWRSTASTIGTAATWATPPSSRSSITATAPTS